MKGLFRNTSSSSLSRLWHPERGQPGMRAAALTVVLAAAIKAVLYLVDSMPNLFMGDLEVFLSTALFGAIPTARPWLYGAVIHVICGPFASLEPLLVAQAVAGVVTATAVTWIAAARLGVRSWLAVAAGCAVAIAPLQFYWERAVMTESFSTGLYLLGLAWALRTARRLDLGVLLVAQLLGVAAVAMRAQLLPTVAATLPWVPLVTLAAARGEERRRLVGRAVVHVAVAAAVLAAGVSGLARLNGALAGRPPALGWENGYFVVAAWAPVLEPGDAPDPRVAAEIAAPSELPLADHHLLNSQRWAPGGLVDRIVALDPDPLLTNRWAKQTALRALRRDPLGVAGLAVDSWLGLWDRDLMAWLMGRDRGQDYGPTPRAISLLSEHFGLDVTPDWAFRDRPGRRWHAASLPWFRLLALAPLLGLGAVLAARSASRPATALVAWATVPLLAVVVVLNLPLPRMFHPLEPMVIVLGAVLAEAAIRRLRHS